MRGARAGHGPFSLGIDLAWSTRARTGLAVLDAGGRLVASTSVVTDEDVVAFVREHAPGEVVVAIDAPLVVPNLTGRRACEAEVGRIFGRYDAGAHPANRSRPWFDPPRGQVLAERLGWEVDPAVRPGRGQSVAIEVYPHPATVALFGLGSVIPYKAKPGRDLPALRESFGVLMGHMERVLGEVLGLASSARWAQLREVAATAGRKSDLGRIEDEVDAILCAYLAWLWAQEDPRMEVLGDVGRGYIVIPGRPTAPPARRPGRPVDVRPDAVRPANGTDRSRIPLLIGPDVGDARRAAAVLLSGTVGVGKTTVADAVGAWLAGRGVPHAVIDLDALRQSWPAPPGDPFNLAVELENLRAVAGTFLSRGAQRLVLAGVVEDGAARAAYEEVLGVPLRVVRLRARWTSCGRGSRPVTVTRPPTATGTWPGAVSSTRSSTRRAWRT